MAGSSTNAFGASTRAGSYYEGKLEALRDLFGDSSVRLESGGLRVGARVYPIVDDVIILLDPEQYPASLRRRTADALGQGAEAPVEDFAPDIQFTFGEEWQRFPDVLPEHRGEFEKYFDPIDMEGLRDLRVCDLGCGIGRWSHFLQDACRELVLVDFSEAIFVARRNVSKKTNALFFMADIKRLPFRDDFADLIFCLGVLHHLPTDALQEVRGLRRYAPRLLIYLYYALDNRPWYFQAMLKPVSVVRKLASAIQDPRAREALTWVGAVGVYKPLVVAGALLEPFGLDTHVPLYEGYRDKSLKRIRQDVYDRFFTRIEQRVTRAEILELRDTFSEVIVSDHMPYWHFVCLR